MNLNIRYAYGGAPLWYVSAAPGETWRVKIARQNDASMAFDTVDGSGEGGYFVPPQPATYWFFLYTSGMQFIEKISYTVPAPTPPTTPTPQPPPSYDPPSGVEIEGAITPVCQVLKKTAFGENWFAYRQQYTGYTSQFYLGYDKMKAAGLADSQCFLPVPTVPDSSGISQDALDAALQELRSQMDEQIQKIASSLSSLFSDSLNSVVEYLEGMINGLVAGLRSEFLAISDSLRAALQQTADTLRSEFSALVDPVWSALSEMQAAAEEESQAWRKGILDIEGNIHTWIETRILDIMWAALTRPRKEG